MARTSQEQTQERQTFLLNLFRQQPDISSKDALDAFKSKFGATINMKTFNQLRAEAEEEAEAASSAAPVAEEPEVETETAAEPVAENTAAQLQAAANTEASSSSAPAKKPKAKGNGPKNVFVDAPKEHLTFLESIVQQLQEAGAANVRIDHATDRWMVLVVDSK
ncbi:hypothetical protein [Myxococcus landrumensis]|uniref:Uncharacterized protein n=1 Tax=Myxococcus landrumensis TaxID=2813577 RepID=A0ABX7N5N3_9BACT|nr:hypothetical protein [Myxococcus landrumus]QSQ13776.1 hypothetical protein JY572_36530 [Myxococcus landrumus]